MKIFRILILLAILEVANAKSFKDGFELYGDIFQFLPAIVAIYPLATQDYEGLGYLALSTGSTLGITFAIKYSFVGISKKHPNWASISQRPNNGSFEGFPSGHTSSAFSAAGFAQKRYGSKLGVPTTILATLVGFSRVVAEKHTIAQVLAGAILGYGLSYLITNKIDNFNFKINVDNIKIPNGKYQNYYGLSASYIF